MTLSDLEQEVMADYRRLELAGTHHQIGYEMGRTTPLREPPSLRERETELAFAQACAVVVGQLHPPLLDEARGYAAAQGRGWDEVLPQFSLNLPEGVLSGCTTFVYRLPGCGHVIAARNYDFLFSQRQRYLRRLSPAGYPATLGAQAGLIGSCYDGVNSHGLFAALHLIHAQTAEQVPPGVPYPLAVRIVLETCHTARQAASLLCEMPHLFPFNYVLADADEMLAVEAYPGRVRLRRSRGDCLVVTNYYQLAELRPLHGRRHLETQESRVRWLEGHMARDGVTGAEEGWAWAQRLLRDHSTPICHHRPTQATLWSMVADLSARRVAYCLGAPCRNGFYEEPWPA